MRRVEVAGGIASGKTSLTYLAASVGLRPVCEAFHQNPFLNDFYGAPSRFALQTECGFLLQHYHDVQKIQGDAAVCDFSLFLDKAYARATLTSDEQPIFEQLWEALLSRVGLPKTVVLLSCPPESQLERIQRRGRVNELGITIDYLHQIVDALSEVMFEYRNQVEVIEIDSRSVDFVASAKGIEEARLRLAAAIS